MNRIEQQASTVFVNHNPDLQTCAWEECDEIIFGECVLATITETNSRSGESKKKEWLLCCPDCYVKFDKWFEDIYMEGAGDDHVATIDNGIPDEWT